MRRDETRKSMKRYIAIQRVFHATIWLTLLFVSTGCNIEQPKPGLQTILLSADTSSLNFGDYIEAKISLYDADSLALFENTSIQTKYRGNASAHNDKKSFSLKFDKKTCFEGLPSCRKKWKLNAEYIDKTLIRNKLSYDLFRSFSPTNMAPRVRYSTVFFNEEYHGIYAITERVDQHMLNFTKGDTNAVLFKQPPISQKPEIHQKAYEDFIAFSHWNQFYKGFSERAMEKLISRVYYNQRFPKKSKSDKTYLIYELTTFINNSSDSDFLNPKIFNTYFNLENIIDWHLLLLTTNNEDGLVKNFYLFRRGTDQPFMFCPWDYDHSFGRDGDGEINRDRFVDITQLALINRMLALDAFGYKEKLLNRYLALKNQDILTAKNLKRMININLAELAPHIEKNVERWPIDHVGHFEGSSFNNEMSIMKNWIDNNFIRIEKELYEMQK